jgi:hypothetical protein
MRAGVLVAVLLLAACAGASPSPSGDPVRIIATDQSLFAEPFTVAVIDNETDYQAAWARTARSSAPPSIDFTSDALIYLGMAGSSSCPETFEHLVVDDAAARVYGEWRPFDVALGMGCTDDLAAQGLLLAVSRAALPAGEFTLSLREQLVCPDCPEHPDQAIVSLR